MEDTKHPYKKVKSGLPGPQKKNKTWKGSKILI